MAIGSTFQESFQKALRGLEVGVDGLNQKTTDRETLERELGEPGPERIWYLGDALAQGLVSMTCINSPVLTRGSLRKSKTSSTSNCN